VVAAPVEPVAPAWLAVVAQAEAPAKAVAVTAPPRTLPVTPPTATSANAHHQKQHAPH